MMKRRLSCLSFLFIFSISVSSTLTAQVFHASPTASTGEIDEGTGQALYGGFGLNAEDGAAYNVYRKFARVAPDTPLPVATNVDGNSSAVTWTQVHQAADNPGVIAPGMFMGTSPSTSSYNDQLLYLLPLIDETGGGNGDENMRRNWDMRFGFLEDTEAYVNTQDPNSSGMDLWTGEWGTDGVSLQLHLATNNTLDEEDWYTGVRGGLRTNAADSVFADERGRIAAPVDRSLINSGDAVDDLIAVNEDVFSGVGYDEPIELSWSMALNSPGHADPVRAREVLFRMKAGNVLHEAVFDPGSADDPVAPNDDDEPFSDGFFDWQNATPVFFLGTGGGTMDGVGTVGVFLPGDFNVDGVVNSDDQAIITANMDQIDTTYSKGDLDQDGDTDADDLAAWNALADPWAALDDITDANERIAYVHDVLNTWMGDSNRDGEFNSSDFVQVFTAGEYEDAIVGNSTWDTGDWNGDGEFSSGDFVFAFTDGGYEIGPRPANAVPEPNSAVLTLVMMSALFMYRRK